MSQTLHAIPAATVTHTIAVIHGDVTSDIAVYHARTTDARIGLTFGTTLMSLYSADATQGLLEAFATARNAMARVPRLIVAPPEPPYAPFARTTLSIEWTRRPSLLRGSPVRAGEIRRHSRALGGSVLRTTHLSDPRPGRPEINARACSPAHTRPRSRCSSTGPTTPPTPPATTTARRARGPLRPGRLTA